jgi:hypothetical protein
MVKIALLIGVSEYQPDFTPLPAAKKDVEAMQRVLQNPEIGGFDEVTLLINPEPQPMREAIETLFNGRKKDDLLLLFFSGHGSKDSKNKLYLATSTTYKKYGELVKSTTVPASFVQEEMNNSRSKRKVVILDSCFSGAFADGLSAKDDGFVDIKNQLGGEGSAVLTSSTSIQYSFEQQGSELSVYTRYIVEGIENGEADQNKDGVVSVDELHEYVREKVRETTSAMNPEIYAVKEGFKIRLAKTPVADPKLRYRSVVERCVHRCNGEISRVDGKALDSQRKQLELSPVEARTIETEVLKHYEEHKEKLQEYKEFLIQEKQRKFPFSEETRNELKRSQQALGLSDKDIALIEEQVTPRWSKAVHLPKRLTQGWRTQANAQRINVSSVPQSVVSIRKTALWTVIFLVVMGSVAGLIAWLRLEQSKNIQQVQALLKEGCIHDNSLGVQPAQDKLTEAKNLLNEIHNLIWIEDKTVKDQLIKQIKICNAQLNQKVETQKQNQEAQLKFKEATDIGSKAYQITFNPPPKLNIINLEKWQETENLWQKAINILQSIATSTSVYSNAQDKKTQYQKYLNLVQESIKQERKAQENLKNATELYGQIKKDIKNYKRLKDLNEAEEKWDKAVGQLSEISPNGTTVSLKTLNEEKSKYEVLQEKLIELKDLESELKNLIDKCSELANANLKFKTENNLIDLSNSLNEVDSYKKSAYQKLREKLQKKHSSLLGNLDHALNAYDLASKVVNYCDKAGQSCYEEKGSVFLDEKVDFKEQLIKKYRVQLQLKPLSLSLKQYFERNDAIDKILQVGDKHLEVAKNDLEKAKRRILEEIN